MLLSWLLETRLVSEKAATEEAYMYTLDGTDTEFTSKWTGSGIFIYSVQSHKSTVIQLISWCGNFVERHSFHIVSGKSRTMT